jgi:putative ABC transport system permease protein
MHDEVMPVMMIVFPFNSIWNVFIRINPGDVQGAMEVIENTWMELVPEFTYDYGFLTEMLDEQYRNEDRWSRITAIASLIAIFLSCLGLLGISGLLVVRRVKEIGIRKANGSTAFQVVLLLNRDILKWVLVSFVLACPVAWLIGRRWLQDFAFRTGISWWLFVLAGALTLVISLLTISWQTYRAARQNPVNALRYE